MEAAGAVDATTTYDETTDETKAGDADVCSLREAVEGINGCAGQTIYLAPTTCVLTDSSSSGVSLVPWTTLTITMQGGNAVIQGEPGWPDRIPTVANNTTVTISNVTIREGTAAAGGGILNSGTLSLMNCQILSNSY